MRTMRMQRKGARNELLSDMSLQQIAEDKNLEKAMLSAGQEVEYACDPDLYLGVHGFRILVGLLSHMPCQGDIKAPILKLHFCEETSVRTDDQQVKTEAEVECGSGVLRWMGLRPEFHDFHHFRRLQALGKASEGVSSPTVEQ